MPSCDNCGRRCARSRLRPYQDRRVCTRCRTTLSRGVTSPTPTIVAGRDHGGSLQQHQDQQEAAAGGSGRAAGIDQSQSFSENGNTSFSNHNGPGMVMGGRRATVEESSQAEMIVAMEEERASDRDNGDPQPPAVANEAPRNTGNVFNSMTDEEVRVHSAPGGAVETGQGHQEEEDSPNRDVLVPIDAPDHHDVDGSTESIRRAFLHLSLYRREFPSSALEEHEDAFRGEIVRQVFDAFALSGGTLPPEYNHVVTPRQRFGSTDIRSIHFLEDSCPLDLDPVVEEQFAPAHGMATNLLCGTWDAQEKNLEPYTQQRSSSESSEVFGLGIVPGLSLKRGARCPFWALNLETVWLGPRGDGKRLEVPGWCLAFQNDDVKHAATVYLLFCVFCATLDDMCGMNPSKAWKPYQLRSLLQRGLSPEGQEKYHALASSLLDDFNFLRSIYKEGLSLDWRDDLLKKAHAHADWGRSKPREQFGHTFEDGVLVGWYEGNISGPWGRASDYLNLRFGWHWKMIDWFLKVDRWSWKYSPHDMVNTRFDNGREREWHAGDGMSTYAPAKKVCSFDLGYLVDQMMVPQGEEQAPLSSVQLFALRPTGIDGNPEYHPVDVLKSMCLTYVDQAFAHCRRVKDGLALSPGRVMCPVGPFAFINSVRRKGGDPGTEEVCMNAATMPAAGADDRVGLPYHSVVPLSSTPYMGLFDDPTQKGALRRLRKRIRKRLLQQTRASSESTRSSSQ